MSQQGQQQHSGGRPQKEYSPKQPQHYEVVFHNDDVTTMDFVVMLLVTVFGRRQEEAIYLMLKVHHEGSAVVGTYTLDIARSKTDKATRMARDAGFPLRITYRPAGLPF